MKFTIPPFDPGRHTPETYYSWWSWHPMYPYWSRSCWGDKTESGALKKLSFPMAHSMRYYHNKLIKETDGKFVEVVDRPCEHTDTWIKIIYQKKAFELESKR